MPNDDEPRWRRGWGLVKATGREWWNDNTFRLAASLAFYTIFSIAPILLIAIYFAERIFGREAATRQVVNQMEKLLGYDGGQAVKQVAENLRHIEGGPMAITLGIVLLIIGSTVFFAELQSALNQIWDVKTDAVKNHLLLRLVRDRMVSFAMAVSVGFLLLVSLLLSAGISGLEEYMGGRIPDMIKVWSWANFIMTFALTTLLFAMIYKVLPDAKIRWRDVWIGALVTAVLFTLGKHVIGLYLGQMAYGKSYGAAGSFVVFLIWVYYSALICFFGAEFTQVYTRREGRRIKPVEYAERRHEKPNHVDVEP